MGHSVSLLCDDKQMQCCGSISFYYEFGSGSADPFEWMRENITLFYFFSAKNLFFQRMICFVIYELIIYVR